MKKTNRGKTIFLICFLSFLVVVLLFFMISVIFGWLPIRVFSFSSYQVSKELAYEKIYDVNFQEIQVDASLGDIEVLPSNDEMVHVLIYSDRDLFDVDSTSSNLSIVFREEEGFHFSLPRSKDLIKIYVPDSTKSSFLLLSDYGDIRVKEFSNASFDVTANMGDISVLKAKKVEVDNDMGDVTIGSVRNLKVIQDMGDLEVDTVSSKLSIESDMGDVFLKDVSLKYNSKIISNLGNVEIENISNAYVDTKVDLGEVDIRDNNREAPYTLTIQSDMGDITVG